MSARALMLLNENEQKQESLKTEIEQLSAQSEELSNKINKKKEDLDDHTYLINLLKKDINENHSSHTPYGIYQFCKTDLMYEFLKTQQKACDLKDIAEYLLKSGYTTSAKDFPASVKSSLHNSKKFKKTEESLWALAEWDHIA